VSAEAPGPTCPNCGARFSPDVTGACRYCQTQLVMGAGGGPGLDPDLLAGRLRQVLASPGGPERVAAAANQVLDDCAKVSSGRHGKATVTFHIVDHTITLTEDRHGVSGESVHEVRGVVLSRTPLDLAEAARLLATSFSRATAGRPDVAAELGRAF
jgi:hypothetical protein